jgi:hemoglobin
MKSPTRTSGESFIQDIFREQGGQGSASHSPQRRGRERRSSVHFELNTNGRRVSPLSVALALALVVTAIAFPIGRSVAQEKPAGKSLYQRLGGYDVIAGIVDDFLVQMRSAPEFAHFGGGRGRDSLTRTRQLVVDQICFLAGGPCTYIGRDMRTTHEGLKITDAEWDSMMKKFQAALEKNKIAAPEQQDFLAMIEGLRPAIVENPKEEKSPPQK